MPAPTTWRTPAFLGVKNYSDTTGSSRIIRGDCCLPGNSTEIRAYELLYRKCGLDNLYILSAGWGLIRADFLTPAYDITFSNAANVEKHQRRGKRDAYADFRMLPDETVKPVVFFGGKDYVGLFCELTGRIQGPRRVFYNSNIAPKAPGCQTRKFHTNTRTNWHYEAARAYVEGLIN